MQDLATELMGVAELPLREPALQMARNSTSSVPGSIFRSAST
jgi:hypothetical protein